MAAPWQSSRSRCGRRSFSKVVTTINPAVAPDGSNVDDAPHPVTQPHICNKSYLDVEDRHEDLSQLIATCQRHTRCSEAYCLRTRHGKQACRFGYPKPLQPETVIVTEDEPTLLTARNDGMINSFNPVQLSARRAYVDMQFIVSRRTIAQSMSPRVRPDQRLSRTHSPGL